MRTETREESTVTRDSQEGEGPGLCRLLDVAAAPHPAGEADSGVLPCLSYVGVRRNVSRVEA